jgi:hypothetical protein
VPALSWKKPDADRFISLNVVSFRGPGVWMLGAAGTKIIHSPQKKSVLSGKSFQQWPKKAVNSLIINELAKILI